MGRVAIRLFAEPSAFALSSPHQLSCVFVVAGNAQRCVRVSGSSYAALPGRRAQHRTGIIMLTLLYCCVIVLIIIVIIIISSSSSILCSFYPSEPEKDAVSPLIHCPCCFLVVSITAHSCILACFGVNTVNYFHPSKCNAFSFHGEPGDFHHIIV